MDLEIPKVFFDLAPFPDNDIQFQAVIRCDGAEQNITSCNFTAITAVPNFAGIQCIGKALHYIAITVIWKFSVLKYIFCVCPSMHVIFLQ